MYSSHTGQNADNLTDDKLKLNLNENMIKIFEKSSSSADLNVRELTIGTVNINILTAEAMTDTYYINKLVSALNKNFPVNSTAKEIYDFLENTSLFSTQLIDVYTFDELFRVMNTGMAVVLIDGLNKAIALTVNNFEFRAVSEPTNEVNERGSKESFTEPIRINMSLLRRRIKSPTLTFDMFSMGQVSKTDICLVYMTDAVSKKLLRNVKAKLKKSKLKIILDSGYLQPFLESDRASLFSDVGVTERPDTLISKISEGRIGILVDGTPFALIVPYLFSENFQSMDDYCFKPYYATFIRILKYIAFAIAIFLPGSYVAICTFHFDLIPNAMLFNILASQEMTPFPIMVEAFVIHFIYEIMREAGIRLPRPIGHAVSIVGALVIGDAAVTAGLISSPMVMVVALTAISGFVVPTVHQPVLILRFAFIIIGGELGLYGIALGGVLILVNACSLEDFGVPFFSPISPFNAYSMRDTFARASFKTLQNKTAKIEDFNGVDISETE